MVNDLLSSPIAVLGAGSWGTALAIQLARVGRPVILWGRDAAAVEQMAVDRCNKRYLPDAAFPESLTLQTDLTHAVREVGDVLVVVPSHAFRGMLESLEYLVPRETRLAWATKGFEQGSGKLPHQVACDVLGSEQAMAVLSGPTFAKEVGDGFPTLITVAANDAAFADDMALSLSNASFRAYTTNDMTGVEVGAAVKNALAIGAGISDGLGFGANTRIALITRGLAEMSRLGMALGAEQETFMGLAGMGDLVLTCTDNLSRNRRMGLKLAEGKSIDEAAEEIGQVVEGVRAAKAVHEVARQLAVDTPIIDRIYAVLYEGKNTREAVAELMQRGLTRE
ncbi:MAG: NAD(P)H-dependent glycerol-3-phosphate dehydrogenase [Gammaproteobacteria bacterium]